MILNISLLLFIGIVVIFSKNGMSEAYRIVTPVAPTRPTRDLGVAEIGLPSNSTGFHCGITQPESRRNISRNIPGSTWERFHVYMGPSITDSQRDMVNRALYELSQVVCIPFGIWPVDDRPSGDYVEVTNTEGSCWANLGRLGGKQGFNFQSTCWTYSNVLHDFMHSLGVDHEHSRPDRDDFVTVHWENIQDEFLYAFGKEPYGPIPSFGVTYNPRALTHYPSWAYSKNGLPAITMKDGAEIPANEVLRDTDIEVLRRMYNCN